MDEISIYNGVIPVKDYIRKVAEAYELTSAESVMLLQVFTDWLALERAAGEEVTTFILIKCILGAARRLGRPADAHLAAVAIDVGLQSSESLLALDAVSIEDDRGSEAEK